MQAQKIIDALAWRYAVQMFDPSKPISDEELNAILESGRLAPSSLGLEPWKFIVVEDRNIREKLKEVGFGQIKITDAAKLIVIAYRTDIEDAARERVELTAKTLKTDVSNLEGMRKMISGTISQRSSSGSLAPWAMAQSYIPLGIMVETAALLGIDSAPMEGFSPDHVDDILGLKEKHLRSVTMLALGHRGEDKAALRPKVRRSLTEVVEFV